MTDAHAFVLAGGRGTRFWPLSRRAQPKQLLDFTGEGPLLALTLERILPVIPSERQWIITGDDLVEAVRDAAPDLPPDQVIGEPVGRNTAPAVALAAALLESQAADSPFVVLPSDHLITPAETFQEDLRRALDVVTSSDSLLTFGIKPSRPETGYGYIEVGEAMPEEKNTGVQAVAAFVEKPDRATAARYVASGRHYWNSGMFAWRSDVVLAALREHQPEMVRLAESVAAAGTEGRRSALEEAYGQMPAVSVDYALMEKARNVVVLPARFSWNDVGHWLAMRELWTKDAAGNAARGDILALESRDNIVFGEDRLTALLGVSDLVVVQTEDVTLVCAADRAQELRTVLDELNRRGDERYL
jgi:mannose-1-phosphate guanylyltransferase